MADGYVTFEQFQAWGGGQNLDKTDLANQAIAAASRWIDEHCQRSFVVATADEVRTFEAGSCYELTLGPWNDLRSVTTLATDTAGDGTFETTWAATDYELHRDHPDTTRPYQRVEAVGGRLFPVKRSRVGRSQRVQITGKWGWASVPTQVEQACLIQASRIYKRKESPEGVAGFGEFAIRVSGRVDPDVADLLAALRHPAAVAPLA